MFSQVTDAERLTPTKRASRSERRGYFGIGIVHGKTETNVGTLMRSAQAFGADFAFTVARRYDRQASDTTQMWRHVPLYHYESIDDLVDHLPYSCPLIGVELDMRARELPRFVHPERGAYLLGAEDNGLTEEERRRCHQLIVIPQARYCLNVSTAGSIVLYDRAVKMAARDAEAVA